MIPIGPDPELPVKSAVIFWADGVDHQRFDELLAAGKLPNIERVFVKGGVTVEYGIDSIPSVTYANGASLITGRYPGHNGITGNLWLDRRNLQTSYYLTLKTYLDNNNHIQGPTLYDILSDQFTLNIWCHSRRGVSQSIDYGPSYGWHWFWNTYDLSDAEMPADFARTANIARQVGRWPTVITTYCSGVDEIGHLYGPNSPQYTHSLEIIDDNVGRMTETLKTNGVADRTYFILASDHGMVPTPRKQSIDLCHWLRHYRGLEILATTLQGESYTQRMAELDDYDAFVAIGSDRHATIHIPGKQGWFRTPLPGEVEEFTLAEPSLLTLPTVDCAVMRDGPDRVKILSARGSAVVERDISGQCNRYRINNLDGDPLGYETDSDLALFVAAGWHRSRDWLTATCQTSHPDFVPQIVDMFDSSRAGDIVLFAADEAAFARKWRGGHGSCLRRDMHVVQLWSGPDLPPGTSIRCSRLVDITPTVVGLLGEADRLKNFPPLDGINIARQLKNAKPATTSQ